MLTEARPPPSRPWWRSARRALRRWGLWLVMLILSAPVSAGPDLVIRDHPPQCAGAITEARYEGPTTRYAHGVLGDAIEWGRLTLAVRNTGQAPFGDTEAEPCPWETHQISVELPEQLVFEDTAPRLADLDGDGLAEVITVEASLTEGARLSIWGMRDTGFTRLAATPYIGRANRWLAPLGAADLDGDGMVEVAYIDRPHLAKTLRIWRYRDGALEPVADAPGLTNHRIGWDYITGGIRDCGTGPEIVTASGNWRRLMAVRLVNGEIVQRDLGRYWSEAEAAALDCASE